MPKPLILEQPEGWRHLQQWFKESKDPLRPWNVSAISRRLKLSQPVTRSLLRGLKDEAGIEAGMYRTAFTSERLHMCQRLFQTYYNYAPPQPQ